MEAPSTPTSASAPAPTGTPDSSSNANVNANGKRSITEAHEFEPPQASVRKILKSTLPEHATISKEANCVFTRAAGIFIMYLTSCANDLARDSGRSSIAAQDILAAVKELELEEIFEGKLQEFLSAFRSEEEKKKADKIAGKAATSSSTTTSTSTFADQPFVPPVPVASTASTESTTITTTTTATATTTPVETNPT